jgi:hypothetical protein
MGPERSIPDSGSVETLRHTHRPMPKRKAGRSLAAARATTSALRAIAATGLNPVSDRAWLHFTRELRKFRASHVEHPGRVPVVLREIWRGLVRFESKEAA